MGIFELLIEYWVAVYLGRLYNKLKLALNSIIIILNKNNQNLMPSFSESNSKCPALPRPVIDQRSSTQAGPKPCSQASNHQRIKDKKKFISKQKLRQLARNRALYPGLINSTNKQNFQTSRQMVQAQTLPRHSLSLNQKFGRFLQECVDEICCPICKCGIVEGVSTDCGHIFCQQCIETSLLVGNRCPMCRSPVFENEEYGAGFSKGVQHIIQRVNNKVSNPDSIRLKQEHQLWKKDRLLTQAQVLGAGFKLDILSYQGRWRQATVVEKFIDNNNGLEQLLVQYDGDFSSANTEVIPFLPLRVAPYGFYTQRLNGKETRLNHFLRNQRDMLRFQQVVPETRDSQVLEQSEMVFSGLNFLQEDVGGIGRGQVNSIQAREFILIPGSVSISEYSMPDILMVESEQLFSPEENREVNQGRLPNSSQ